MTELTLTVNRDIKANPEQVYNAWLNPELLAQFMIPGEGMSVPVAVADAQVGGRFKIIMAAGEQQIPHRGNISSWILTI